MGDKILSAYLGDERSSVDVLESLRKKAGADGSISTLVDSSLIPLLQFGSDVSLTNAEIDAARKKAVSACGGGTDVKCIETKRLEFQRIRLQEKINERQSLASVVKGRRLTVEKQDARGRKSILQIPEGQIFNFGKPKGKTAPPKPIEAKKNSSILPNITLTGTVLEIVLTLVKLVLAFLYVFSILVTYMTFKDAGYVVLRYLATGASVLIPYSGLFITVVFFAVRRWIQKMPVPA